MCRKVYYLGMICLLMITVLSSVCMAKKPVNATSDSNRDWNMSRVRVEDFDKYEQRIIRQLSVVGERESELSKTATMLITLANENMNYEDKYTYDYVEGKLGDILDKYDYHDDVKNIQLNRIRFCQPIPDLNSLPIKNKEIIEYFNKDKKYLNDRKQDAHSSAMKVTLITLYNAINNPEAEIPSSIDRVIETDYALSRLESPYWEGIEQNGVVSTKPETYAPLPVEKISPNQHTCLELMAHIYIVNQKIYRKAPASTKTVSQNMKRIAVFQEAKDYIASPEFMPNLENLSEEEKEKFNKVQSLLLSIYTANIEDSYKLIEILNRYEELSSNPLLALAYTMSNRDEIQYRDNRMRRLMEEYDRVIQDLKHIK